jgi:hypothetical protein
MKKLLESIGRWIEQADAGDITGVVWTAAIAIALLVMAIGEAFRG